ncbi:hypothetical protein DFJ74DRAFT_687736 [Hyaloraphidium curvatum]|nr:hypothetical protein DFJ74DRAFT_687736 [Hyaloraphidium curvatum]
MATSSERAEKGQAFAGAETAKAPEQVARAAEPSGREDRVTVRVREPVIHEVIKEIEEVRVQPIVHRTIIRPEIEQIIQPIRETVRMETVVEKHVLPVDTRTFTADVPPIDQRAIKEAIAKLEAESKLRGQKEERFIQLPAQVSESVQTIKIRETIPVRIEAAAAPALADRRELHPDLLTASGPKEALPTTTAADFISGEQQKGAPITGRVEDQVVSASERQDGTDQARAATGATTPSTASKGAMGTAAVPSGSAGDGTQALETSHARSSVPTVVSDAPAEEMRSSQGSRSTPTPPSETGSSKKSVVNKVKQIFS